MRFSLSADELRAVPQSVREAAERFVITRLESSQDPRFDQAYRILHAEFGQKGELERREVIASWLDGRLTGLVGYHLLLCEDENGEICGVRDCHVRYDTERRLVVVYLAHVYVAPAQRRSGLGGLLRLIPDVLGRRQGEPGEPVVLAAEMEPYKESDPATAVRLIAYGKAGFRAVDPTRCRYFQPDFHATASDHPRPLSLLLVVKQLDQEAAHSMPAEMVCGVVQALFDVFASHCPRSHLTPLLRSIVEPLAGAAAVPLLPLNPGG